MYGHPDAPFASSELSKASLEANLQYFVELGNKYSRLEAEAMDKASAIIVTLGNLEK